MNVQLLRKMSISIGKIAQLIGRSEHFEAEYVSSNRNQVFNVIGIDVHFLPEINVNF